MIRQFLSQTLKTSELLIVADGETVRDLVPEDPRIRLIEIEGCANVGQKRNLGCDEATGQFVAHMDDDDFSSHSRFEQQVELLEKSGAQVCGQNQMFFTDGADWWSYQNRSNFAVGSSMMYQRAWQQAHPFRAIQIAEDVAFSHAANEAGVLRAERGGNPYWVYASIHGRNTSTRQLFRDDLYFKLQDPQFPFEIGFDEWRERIRKENAAAAVSA